MRIHAIPLLLTATLAAVNVAADPLESAGSFVGVTTRSAERVSMSVAITGISTAVPTTVFVA